MNVPPPEWGNIFPTRQPLSSGLRAVFRFEPRLPLEVEKLLMRLDRRLRQGSSDADRTSRAADRPGAQS